MFDKKKSIKKIGIIIIAVAVLAFVIYGVKIKSISGYQAQKEAIASEQQKLGDGYTSENSESNNTKDESEVDSTELASISQNESATGTDDTISIIDASKANDNNGQGTAALTGNVDTTASQNGTGIDSEPSDIRAAGTDNKEPDGTQKQAETGATQSTDVTCTIEIRCDAAAAKKSEISNPGVRDAIPDDGTILEKTTYIAKAGATVYDVLRDVAKQKGIPIYAASTGYGMYVSSIHNLAQKDVGANSGWIYEVNGSWGQSAADHYKVAEGDVICWKYVTDYGD